MAFWIEDIKRHLGVTVLMVEHDMNLVSARVGPRAGAEPGFGDRRRHAGRSAGASGRHRGISG